MPFNALFSFLIKKRLQQIELFRDNPVMAQLETFHSLVRSARYTEWGRKYDYPTITDQDEFRRRVPVQDYEDVKPWVARLRAGEQNLLWPTDVKWFAKSSGTMGDRSKFIPVSREALEDCHYKGGKDLIALHYQQFPESKLYQGMSLVVGGSSTIEQFRSDAYSGDLSAIIIRNLPLWVEVRRTPVIETALMENWEEKIERMARETMREDVRCIAGVPSWTLVLLRRILELTGKKHMLEVWPNLELFMHGGVSFRPYRKQFEELIPSATMNYLETYNASEGSFGIQDRRGADDMLLMLDYGIFYEFMPIEELGKQHPRTLLLDEVEPDVQYAIVISTNAGLWRYMPGDTVQFTSVRPFRIQVSGRTKSFINAFGEELIVDNADRGIEAACAATGAVVSEYTAAPVYMEDDARGGHEWAIEFEQEPSSLAQFTDALDTTLRSLNSDYDAKRRGDMALRAPVLHTMERGTFHAWLRGRGKLGGQHKVPRLSNDRVLLESLLAPVHVLIRHVFLIASLGLALRALSQDTPQGYVIEGRFDAFTTDELGNVYALHGDEIRLFDPKGRSWLRNSTKTFGRIGSIDAFYSLKPMLFAPEQGQIAVLDNTLSLQASVINLPRNGFPQVVLACVSVQNHFWFFDQREMALVRVDNQLRKRANTGRLDQVLGFVVEPKEMMEFDGRLYVNDPKQGVLVFDLFGTYMKNIPILDARSVEVRGDFIYYQDATGAHGYDMRSFTVHDFKTEVPAEKVRAMRVEGPRVYLLLEDRILVQVQPGAEH